MNADRLGAGLLNRRSLLAGAATFAVSNAARSADPPRWPLDADFRRERSRVEALAEQADLGPFRAARAGCYLAIGDADDAYLTHAASLCAGLATGLIEHFRARGFALRFDGGPLTIVVLKDRGRFARLVNAPGDRAGRGVFLANQNLAVVFQAWTERSAVRLPAGEERRRSITHEAAHQVALNGGLVGRSDVPAWLNEGLATYCEVYSPEGRVPIGQINTTWLDEFWERTRTGLAGLDLDRLFVDDALFSTKGDDGSTSRHAYARSWLVVHACLTSGRLRPQFRDYLAAILGGSDDNRRIADIEQHFGSLDRLTEAVHRHAARLPKLRPSEYRSIRRPPG